MDELVTTDMNHGTKTIEEVGEILKSLNPTSIAVLLFVMDDTIEKQVDMAAKLSCTSAPVSLSLQSLSQKSNPLVTKNRTYQITRTGQEVVARLDEMMLDLNINLCDIDWSSGTDKEEVDKVLRPLHNSRSMLPFHVLDSINDHTGSGGNAQIIAVDDIVDDVRERTVGNEGSVSRRQVLHAINRFETDGAIDMDSNRVTVREKGNQQAWLYNRLFDFLSDDGTKEMNIPVSAQEGTDEKSFQIPSRITIGELSDHVQRLEEQYGRDEVLELHWSLKKSVPATTYD